MPTITKLSRYASSLPFSSRMSLRWWPWGGRNSSTRIVMRMAITPSLNAFMRSGLIGRVCQRSCRIPERSRVGLRPCGLVAEQVAGARPRLSGTVDGVEEAAGAERQAAAADARRQVVAHALEQRDALLDVPPPGVRE